MIHHAILNKDETALKAIALSHEIHRVVENVAGPSEYYWKQVPLAVEAKEMELLLSASNVEQEIRWIKRSLPEMEDEQIKWLIRTLGNCLLSFTLVAWAMENRPGLL